MKNNSFNLLKSDLISLGFAYSGKESKMAPDPELTIVRALGLFNEDQKLYRMVLAWLERFGDLVHVERIAGQIDGLTDEVKLCLGVTALKQMKCGDTRFKVIYQKIHKLKINLNLSLSGNDSI